MKNVPGFERALRVTIGAVLLTGSILGGGGWPLHLTLAACGLVAILTGGSGYCPACAVAGERI